MLSQAHTLGIFYLYIFWKVSRLNVELQQDSDRVRLCTLEKERHLPVALNVFHSVFLILTYKLLTLFIWI